MPQGIELLRNAAAKNSGNAFGLKFGQPTKTVGDQKIGPGEHADVFALPVDASNWQPLQDLDPASATFGRFYGMIDYDFWGDPTKIWR